MPYGVISPSDSGLQEYGENFTTLIAATPGSYFLTTQEVAQATDAYSDFVAKLAVAKAPGTKTKVTVYEKDQAAKNLRRILSSFGGMISANRAVSDSLKLGLGLGIRGGHRQPIPAPSFSPIVHVKSVTGKAVAVDLLAPGGKKSRPKGVACATVMACVGEVPNPDPSKWLMLGNLGKMSTVVTFGSDVAAGAKVWISAYYSSPRFESGPAAAPISVNLQIGTVPVNG